jgi:hypothetical protein
MTPEIPRPDIYDPKTLAVMDQAFAWQSPFVRPQVHNKDILPG